MDYTPEAWDADFEQFHSAVAESDVAESDMVVCKHCDWIGEYADIRDELEPECPKCGGSIDLVDGGDIDDCPLDGDAESAFASIGWGMDEDYRMNEPYEEW